MSKSYGTWSTALNQAWQRGKHGEPEYIIYAYMINNWSFVSAILVEVNNANHEITQKTKQLHCKIVN